MVSLSLSYFLEYKLSFFSVYFLTPLSTKPIVFLELQGFPNKYMNHWMKN